MRSALTTTTKSPVSTWRVNHGERFPLSVSAIDVDRRPRFCPSASTIHHWRSTVPALALTVFTVVRVPPDNGNAVADPKTLWADRGDYENSRPLRNPHGPPRRPRREHPESRIGPHRWHDDVRIALCNAQYTEWRTGHARPGGAGRQHKARLPCHLVRSIAVSPSRPTVAVASNPRTADRRTAGTTPRAARSGPRAARRRVRAHPRRRSFALADRPERERDRVAAIDRIAAHLNQRPAGAARALSRGARRRNADHQPRPWLSRSPRVRATAVRGLAARAAGG